LCFIVQKPIQDVGEDDSGSEDTLPQSELWVFSAPSTSISQINNVLAEFGMTATWTTQPLDAAALQAKIFFDSRDTDIPALVVALAATKSVFELDCETNVHERYLHHPMLGICRNELDLAGEVVLRAGQLEKLLLETAGNLSDFSRGFRRLVGIPWLDLVEPYRKASEYLIALPRAV